MSRLNSFQKQVVEEHDPMVYLFTRHLGTLRISPLMSLNDWIENGEEIEFSQAFETAEKDLTE